MGKAVFTHKPHSIYDDDPYRRYHFPRAYLKAVEAALGDFIVYYEPGRSGIGDGQRTGRLVYFATARVTHIEADARQSDHFYAFVEDYLDFERPVPFREEGGTYERRLTKADGSTNRGLFGINVRRLAEDEFEAICRAGFHQGLLGEPLARPWAAGGLSEAALLFERPIVETLVARPFRDAAFSKLVRNAYGHTCAFTGIRLINGGGRSEVQSAHIRPVHASGPDTVRNGLALSGTVHWMFDRGLISIADDLSILFTSRGLPDNVRRLFHPDGKIKPPGWSAHGPARDFLDFHRREVFKP